MKKYRVIGAYREFRHVFFLEIRIDGTWCRYSRQYPTKEEADIVLAKILLTQET